MFYGRKEELDILEKRFNSEHFEFGFIYGQRRIGKTSLIDEFSKSHKTVMFFIPDSDDGLIRRDLSNQLFMYLDKKGQTPYENWESFFIGLKESFNDEKVMIVFDEYPNALVGHDGKRKKTDFDEKLQNAIDHIFKDTKLSIVIMGSNVSFMQNIIQDKVGPLYKRHTFTLFISKLRWNDALKFVEKMPLDDQIKTLSLLDTFPYYLSHIDQKLSFEENLDNFFFNRDSLITIDPTFTISSNMSITGFYVGIMRCLVDRVNTIKEMGNVLKAESGKVSLYLEELLKSNVINKSSYFNSSRSTYYEINDRMTAFYFKFVQPYLEHIKLGNGMFIKNKEKNAIDDFMHHSYEKLCITYLNELNNQGKLNTFYLSFTNFRADKTSLNRSVEVDIVGEDNGSLLLGECKYSKKEKGVDVYNHLKESGTIKPFDTYKKKYYYIFSHTGFNDELKKCQDSNLYLISSKDMLEAINN